MMKGESKKCSRSELVRMKATGDEKEFSDWVLTNLLERGHEVEAFGRCVVEGELGEDLYPVTATDDEGYLIASMDGVTMDGETGFECKLWNEELVAAVRAHATELPGGHHWQMEQQLDVFVGMKRVIFVVTDGTAEKCVSMVYTAVPGRAAQLRAGWKQFDEDVANYQHVEVIPKAVAEPTVGLPAVAIEVTGKIDLASNLPRFGEMLRAFIDAVPKKPATDQEFANCEAAITTLQTAQDRLEAAENAALARFETIDEMRTTVAALKEVARSTRLMLEKLVKARKDTVRNEILGEGAVAFGEHLAKLNERLGRPYMPVIRANFAEVMKGKKTIAGLRDAVAVELARVKIESNDVADRIQVNLNLLHEQTVGCEMLFADVAQLVLKAKDDFALVVKSRIADHKAAEEKRLEGEREKIRAEEAAKLVKFASTIGSAPAPAAAVHDTRTGPTHGTARLMVDPPRRPDTAEIIVIIATHYLVSEAQALVWLVQIGKEDTKVKLTAFAS